MYLLLQIVHVWGLTLVYLQTLIAAEPPPHYGGALTATFPTHFSPALSTDFTGASHYAPSHLASLKTVLNVSTSLIDFGLGHCPQ